MIYPFSILNTLGILQRAEKSVCMRKLHFNYLCLACDADRFEKYPGFSQLRFSLKSTIKFESSFASGFGIMLQKDY